MNLQNSTIFMIIGFVIIAGMLIIIINQIRMLNAISSLKDLSNTSEVRYQQKHEEPVHYNVSALSEPQLTQGKTEVLGTEDSETIAAIMAAVSSAANMPLSAIQITSIKRIN